jgi:hypothetical protein
MCKDKVVNMHENMDLNKLGLSSAKLRISWG